MNHINKRRISIGVLTALLLFVMSITAYAATQLFSSKQVAEHLGEQILAEAFESSGAIEINQSIASGDYQFTLHGIVSGAGLKALDRSGNDIYPNRTYAVVSIARQDGGQMPNTSDPDYGNEPFFVSPFIKGQKPWQVNIVTMNGGYSEVVLDGITYRLIECDELEMFADRGVYLAISSGDRFFNSKAFAYNDLTGEISLKKDYRGTALLFDLPLDKTKADPVKADAYLQKLLQEPVSDTEKNVVVKDAANLNAEVEGENRFAEWEKKIPEGTVVAESIKEVTYDDQGDINYEYDNWSVTLSAILFEQAQTGFSDKVFFTEENGKYKALQFFKDENGVITGRVINLN